MRQRCLLFVLLVCAPLETNAQSKAQATTPVAAVDAFVAIVDADPLELARVAARLGDAQVLARLDARNSIETRLAAIRTTPYLRAPEAALPVLVLLIGQRDGVLAQDAARSLLTIVRALDVDGLQRREANATELRAVAAALEKVVAIETLRVDLRSMARASTAMLATLLQGFGGAGTQ